MKSNFENIFFKETKLVIETIDQSKLSKIIKLLNNLRNQKGRLFILGIGGSAGNASHAVNDFRKLCNIDTYTPIDNISEITAKTNDEGFDTIFDTYLKLSKLNKKDIVMIFSVGGGDIKKKISVNLVNAIKYCKKVNSKTISFVGKKGYAYKNSDISLIFKTNDPYFTTPISESMQVLVWHLIVSHPLLQINKTKW